MEKIPYRNFPNCIRLVNNEIEGIVTNDVGPRILKYSFINGENILGKHFEVVTGEELVRMKWKFQSEFREKFAKTCRKRRNIYCALTPKLIR